MKKIIIIALVAFSSLQMNAQNNNRNYNKEGLSQENINIREAYFNSLDKPAILKQEVKGDANMYLTPRKDPQRTTPVSTPQKAKTDLDVRIENATKSGTPGRK